MPKFLRLIPLALIAGAIFVSQVGPATGMTQSDSGSYSSGTSSMGEAPKASSTFGSKSDSVSSMGEAPKSNEKIGSAPKSDSSPKKPTSVKPVEAAKATTPTTMATAASTPITVASTPKNCVGINAIQDVVFKVNGAVIPALRDHGGQGTEISAEFKIQNGCSDVKLGMSAYQAVSPQWVPAEATQQVLTDKNSGTFSADNQTHKLSVSVDACYYQVDFFTGVPLEKIGPDGGYINGTLIAADNGGTNVCTPPVVKEECPSVASAKITNYSYAIGSKSDVKKLEGNVKSGDTVKVKFTIAAGCTGQEVSLVSYESPDGDFSKENLDKQVLFDKATGKFDAGEHSLSVKAPNCFFQIDFVRGGVITKLGPVGTNNFYSDQGRLIDSATGGQACKVKDEPPVRQTTTTTTAPLPTTTTSTTAPAKTEVLDEQIVRSAPAAPEVRPQLAATGIDSNSLTLLGGSLTLFGAGLQGLGVRLRNRKNR